MNWHVCHAGYLAYWRDSESVMLACFRGLAMAQSCHADSESVPVAAQKLVQTPRPPCWTTVILAPLGPRC